MSLADVEIDILSYGGEKDFFVYTQYVDTRIFNIIVKRLDSEEGWEDTLVVFINYLHNDSFEAVTVGPSAFNEKSVTRSVLFDLRRSSQYPPIPNSYKLAACPEYSYVTLWMFNRLFKSDIVILPNNIFAVGIKSGKVYLYCESHDDLYMIDLTIKTLVSISLGKRLFREFYFLICATDGYMQNHYGVVPRNKCRIITEFEMSEKESFETNDEEEYPKFHKGLYILGQSVQKVSPYAFSVVDRYYLVMNKYNEYRSIHRGIPFYSKINAIVFASRPRGSKFNFIKRRDIQVSQREYFYSSAVPKDNIVCPENIVREKMMLYKYILDIDGHSSTWDATAWKLNSGSVILKTDSVWRQWFYDEYKPWVHYVPIAEDFSDIQDKFAWCENNQELCLVMIKRCKELFQRVYRFSNIIDWTATTIFKINSLVPYFLGERRIFFLSNSDAVLPNIMVNRIPNLHTRLDIISYACRRLYPKDILVLLNTSLITMHNFNLKDLLNLYDTFNTKIVFGAENNLWPPSLEAYRSKLINKAGGECKFLNSGFVITEVGEMERVLEEFPCEHYGPNDQEYFTKAYLSEKYNFALDKDSKLVLYGYECGASTIHAKISSGTQFVQLLSGH